MIQVSMQYVREANFALLTRLTAALDDEDWDAVEAMAWALHEIAQTFTKPSAKK